MKSRHVTPTHEQHRTWVTFGKDCTEMFAFNELEIFILQMFRFVQ